MKLVFCTGCHDVFKLVPAETRACLCGACRGGCDTDGLNAWYSGSAVPIGFNNPSLGLAVKNQPQSGPGIRFEAFVIPKVCPTLRTPSPGDEPS